MHPNTWKYSFCTYITIFFFKLINFYFSNFVFTATYTRPIAYDKITATQQPSRFFQSATLRTWHSDLVTRTFFFSHSFFLLLPNSLSQSYILSPYRSEQSIEFEVNMSDEMGASVPINGSDRNGYVVDIYPLSSYYFGSKEAIPFKDETLYNRVLRMKSKY